VTIQNTAFNPADLTVKVGTTVTWTQKDSTGHFVKWADGTAPGPTMALGDTYTRTFATAGTFTYVCGIHASMKGSITVTP
jgi:plastocyanin